MILVVTFVILMFLGLPLFGVIGLATVLSMIGMPFPMEFIPQNLYTGMDQFPLIATIGFVMAGFLMEPAGITGEIIDVAKRSVGNFTGGLAMVTILACMIFAALSGSGPATTAAIGSIMIPGMLSAGYRKDDAAAVSATGGTLGILIPPSNPMILYGVVANTSIGGLFMAGFIPGFVMTTSMCLTAYAIAKKRGYKGTGIKFSFVELMKSIWNGKWALATPVIILGGIYTVGAFMSSISTDPTITLLLIAFFIFLCGFVADTLAMVVVLAPVFLPITNALGIHPIQLGILFVVCCETGFLTPPFGSNLFITMKITDVKLEEVALRSLPYLMTIWAIIFLVAVFPKFTMFLPNLLQ